MHKLWVQKEKQLFLHKPSSMLGQDIMKVIVINIPVILGVHMTTIKGWE